MGRATLPFLARERLTITFDQQSYPMRGSLRKVLAVALAICLAPGLLLRETPPPRDASQRVELRPLALAGVPQMGPFTLSGAWQLDSPDWRFGGYSALAVPTKGRLLAFSDQGYLLDLTQPGSPRAAPRIARLFGGKVPLKQDRDVEAVTRDPATGRLWLALEGRNAIAPLGKDLSIERLVRPPVMQGWPDNSGPEAIVRLADGRFVVMAEAYAGLADWSGHPALLFAGDPSDAGTAALRFTLAGPSGYRPTDAALLPDGRMLLLMRRLVWPFPARFAVKLVLADPAEVVPGGRLQAIELGTFAAPWPVDNYEALALEAGADGAITAWVMSDANSAVTQRNLLLRLAFRMEDLPEKRKARR